MNSKALNTTRSFFLHFIFWVGVWVFYIYFFSYNSNDTNYITWFSGLLLPVTIIATYLTNFILIPKFLLTKRYFKFSLYTLYSLILSAYLILMAIFGGYIFVTDLNITKIPPMGRNFIFIFILVYLVVGLFSFITILKHNLQDKTQLKILENKILETTLQIKEQELDYLKKQIHPHFLFNTLNTIYAFALKKSEYTPELILKLSNLLDYILYQIQKPKVFLTDEIEHLKEYIDLEKIRFQDRLDIQVHLKNIPDDLAIPPMLLIPFVENAFKHGSILNGKLTIQISLEYRNDKTLYFTIRNSTLESPESDTGGIGLKNIAKRLDLLFPDNYTFKRVVSDDWHFIELTLLNKTEENGEIL